MARSNRGQRDASDVANELDSLLLSPSLPSRLVSPSLSDLSLLEDRRTYYPEPDFRPALSHFGQHELEVPARGKSKQRGMRFARTLAHTIGFRNPNRLALCVRRKRRKEVLHALRRTRRGAGASRRLRSWHSKIRC